MQEDCLLAQCAFMASGCGSILAAQPDVILGGSPYGITATETNLVGYTVTLCYQCIITQSGQSDKVFKKDSVTITQTPGCSSYMTPIPAVTKTMAFQGDPMLA